MNTEEKMKYKKKRQLLHKNAFLWLSHYLDPSVKAYSAIGCVTDTSEIMALIQERLSPSLSS